MARSSESISYADQTPNRKGTPKCRWIIKPHTKGPCQEMSIFIHPASLPCGGCRYCVNVHEKWQDSVKVDNVIPLAAARTTASNSKSECSEDID